MPKRSDRMIKKRIEIITYQVSRLLNTGVQNHFKSQEIKNIRLLNFCSIIWIAMDILFIVEDIYVHSPDLTHSVVFIFTILFLVGIILLQKNQYYAVARSIFLILSLVHFQIFAIYFEPGAFLEYLLLLIPIFSLIFFENRWFSFFVLCISYSCFICTMIFFNHYENHRILYTANLSLFVGVYVSFAYFKELNVKSEKSLENQRLKLEKQRNHAVKTGKQIEQQRKELEELNKFQSHFWVNLSHEIRTPLTLIKGSMSKLKTVSNQEKRFGYYDRIEQNSDKIHLIIDNIMDLSKIRSNKLETKPIPTNFNNICKKVVSSFEPLFAQKNINYSFCNETIANGITCNLDRFFIERALGNLLINAHKYTPENGKIEILLLSEKGKISISIKDNGCGIPEEELPFIFDVFYRANNIANETSGTGVGLSFTKEIIELHNGSISAKNSKNKGAEFTITLPIYEINSKTDSTSNSISTLSDLKKMPENGKILLVEDNIEMRMYIKDVLSDYDIIEASQGKEALTIVSQNPPSLIITDYMMPEMNGYEFVKKIRHTGCDIPIIVITARVDEQAKINFLRLGLDDYLTKPFNEEELIIRVAHSINNNKERIRFNKTNKNSISMKEEELAKIRNIIETNMTAPSFNVLELADILATSERTLHRKIKSWSGLTPNQFIREIKLQKAMIYYQNKEANSLKELTAKIGFTNSGHLSKLFENRFGTKLDFRIRM